MFENFNQYKGNLSVIDSKDHSELLGMIEQINGPIQILSIYSNGNRHYCWFLAQQKVVIKKKTKRGN